MRRIAHVSDLHFGAHDPAVVEALVAAVRAAEVDLVVASGDFTQRATEAQFRAARAMLERLPAPALVVPGNHDVPLTDPLARLFAPLAAYRRLLAPAGVTRFADAEIVVAGIETPRRFTGKNGRISREQAEALPALLAGDERTVRILVTHHPLALPDGSPGLALAFRAGKARAAILAAGADMLLSGHYHVSAHGAAEPHVEGGGRLLVVHAGTAVSVRRRGEGNHFNLIEVSPEAAAIAVMGFAGRAFVEEKRSVFARQDGRWVAA
jgi:3',5'-cyclic AMP phosphodiesterase CpdA